MVRNGWNTGRRLGAAGLLMAVMGSTVAGCSGSDPKDAKAPSPAASTSQPLASVLAGETPGEPVAGTPVDGETMFLKITGALLRAKGCTMKASIGAVSINGSFSFDAHDEMGFISKIYAKGDITSNDDRTGTWFGELGQRFADAGFYVNDGAKLDGKPWAKVPRNTANVSDPQGVISAHPLYMLVPEAVPLVEPDNIASLLSIKKGLVKADEPVKNGLTHYYWSVDGTPPVKGGAKVYEVWLDSKDRPVKFAGQVRGAPLQATYGNWGEQKGTDRTPKAADVAELPTD